MPPQRIHQFCCVRAQALAGARQLELLDWSWSREEEPSEESLAVVAALSSLRRLRFSNHEEAAEEEAGQGAAEGLAASVRERMSASAGIEVTTYPQFWFDRTAGNVGEVLRLLGVVV